MQFVVAVCHDEKSLPSLSSELILFNVHVEARGEWECVVSTGRGNTSRSVEILVLENSASFCPEDKVVNNRGEFRLVTAAMIFIVQLVIRRSHSPLALIPRWPRTLAGITSHQYCLQLRYPSLSVEGGIEQKKASRQCDSYGKWKEGDYSDCHYTNGITRVLHTFILVSTAVREKGLLQRTVPVPQTYCYVFAPASQRPINASNAVTLAHQVRTYTLEAAGFTDSVDVLYVAQLMEKFVEYVRQLREVSKIDVRCLKFVMLSPGAPILSL